jgi:hypothetical protein
LIYNNTTSQRGGISDENAQKTVKQHNMSQASSFARIFTMEIADTRPLDVWSGCGARPGSPGRSEFLLHGAKTSL